VLGGSDERARHSVGGIVAATGGVVDGILSRPRDVTFKPTQLRMQALVFQELDCRGVDRGQHFAVQVGLRVFGHAVGDALFAEQLAGKLARIVVAMHLGHAVGFQDQDVILDDVLGTERGSHFAHQIEDRDTGILMGNRERPVVLTAA